MTRALRVVALLVGLSGAMAHAQPGSSPSAPTVEAAGVVNLNNATETELELLPGIGPRKAQAIVDHRRTHPFHKAEELMKVKGIGRKTYGRLRPYLTIVGPSTLTKEVRMTR